MERVNAVQFSIPPGRPHCNRIENLFNLLDRKLQTDALEQNIQHGPYPEFVQRIKKSMNEFQVETIGNIIGSMYNSIENCGKKRSEDHSLSCMTLCITILSLTYHFQIFFLIFNCSFI